MKETTFAGKFIARLEKIDRNQIEAFVKHLWEERSFLERVFHSLVEGLIVTDMESRILFVNRSAYRLLGIRSDLRLLGSPLVEVIKDLNLLKKIREFTIPERGEVGTCEVKVEFPRNATYLFTVIPLSDEETDEITSFVFILSDISEAKQREQALFRQRRLESLATLTAGIAHEIKNPLNALNIHAQLIKREIQKDKHLKKKIPEYKHITESLDIIQEEIQRLTLIVNDFMTAVRPLRLQLKICNVNKILDEIIETIKPELAEKGIELKRDYEPDLPEIKADETLIRQSFFNIIKNSIEALTNENPEIKMITSSHDSYISVTIEDNGKGMTEDDIHRIFEPYFTTKDYGSGLGLFIVYRVIQEHEGEIEVLSHVDKGTEFTVRLPIFRKPTRLLTHKKKGKK